MIANTGGQSPRREHASHRLVSSMENIYSLCMYGSLVALPYMDTLWGRWQKVNSQSLVVMKVVWIWWNFFYLNQYFSIKNHI